MRNQAPSEYLLDTSVQVIRSLSMKWRPCGCDQIWERVTPVASVYSLMEFKNCVVGALRYIKDILGEVKEWKGGSDAVKVRLEELVRFLNAETRRRTGDRRVKIASAYAAKLYAEFFARRRGVSVGELLRQLACEAENVQRIKFLRYPISGKSKEMRVVDRVGCFLGRSVDPFTVGLTNYTCAAGALSCEVKPFLVKHMMPALSAVAGGTVVVRTARLKKGCVAAAGEDWAERPSERSIGQHLCFPIGDLIIVSKGTPKGLGLLTADRDQMTLAKFATIDVILYDGDGKFI